MDKIEIYYFQKHGVHCMQRRIVKKRLDMKNMNIVLMGIGHLDIGELGGMGGY